MSELMRKLDGMYTSEQLAMSVYTQKAQEAVDKIFQLTDLVERLLKHARNFDL